MMSRPERLTTENVRLPKLAGDRPRVPRPTEQLRRDRTCAEMLFEHLERILRLVANNPRRRRAIRVRGAMTEYLANTPITLVGQELAAAWSRSLGARQTFATRFVEF